MGYPGGSHVRARTLREGIDERSAGPLPLDLEASSQRNGQQDKHREDVGKSDEEELALVITAKAACGLVSWVAGTVSRG